MHQEIVNLWNGEHPPGQPRIIDLWDDAPTTTAFEGLSGKVLLNCTAKVALSQGGEWIIQYAVTTERGKIFNYVRGLNPVNSGVNNSGVTIFDY